MIRVSSAFVNLVTDGDAHEKQNAKSIFRTQRKLIIINKNSCDRNGIDDELVVEERQPKKRVRNDKNEK